VSTLGFFPSSGFQRYTLNSRVSVAPEGFGQALPPVILEFFGSANSTICLASTVLPVIAGLDPAIHPLLKMDARVKPAHDKQHQYTRAFGGMYCTSFVIV
jgi:hypothetical protein